LLFEVFKINVKIVILLPLDFSNSKILVYFTYSINLVVPAGSILAIVGNVGAGKSSLISAMLGEIPKLKGSISVSVSVNSRAPDFQCLTI